jgi:antitoxin (DNA-binding transcriptional repressor) of toxin-antitoxin stability system
MKTVGVRELKNRLSEYIRQARAGEGVLVTDRGEVVAELTRPGEESGDALPPGLRSLVRRGFVTLGRGGKAPYPSLGRGRARQSAAQLLDAERGSR